jgi:RNA polymerase sigma-70 factor (ECF subfamily)
LLGRIVEEVSRREGPRILAGLIGRLGGDFDLAEEALQDAFESALVTWPSSGVPDNPAAWITTAARHRAIDLWRRSSRLLAGGDSLLDRLAASESACEGTEALPDERLALLFTCCNPAIAPAAQTALALRTLCGLSTAEIARAYLESESATAQRLVRAKRKISAARIPYRVPSGDEMPERLAAVLTTIYLVFNEGYAAEAREGLLRADLCSEATRLARLLHAAMPREAEAAGLLALMLLHDARRDARLSPEGALVPLEEQDRTRWDAERIAEGLAALDCAIALRAPGPYQMQAAIAALHAKAARAEATDWPQIAALYGALYRALPTPVVALNAAAAFAMVAGPERGLEWMESLDHAPELRSYHLLPAARADLLRRAGRHGDAKMQYEKALALAWSDAERLYLQRRLTEIDGVA